MFGKVFDRSHTVVQTVRVGELRCQAVVEGNHPGRAACSHGIAKPSATVDAAESPSAAVQIEQDGQQPVPASLRFVDAHVFGNHSCIHVVGILRPGIPRVAYRRQIADVAIQSLENGQSLPVLQVSRHVMQKAVGLDAHDGGTGNVCHVLLLLGIRDK